MPVGTTWKMFIESIWNDDGFCGAQAGPERSPISLSNGAHFLHRFATARICLSPATPALRTPALDDIRDEIRAYIFITSLCRTIMSFMRYLIRSYVFLFDLFSTHSPISLRSRRNPQIPTLKDNGRGRRVVVRVEAPLTDAAPRERTWRIIIESAQELLALIRALYRMFPPSADAKPGYLPPAGVFGWSA
ncbi:hypothetical protein EVAR_80073_1 [Eumeta japonica]|uniref:Uncharacterized protein n=1 Tax=Eumeta variegata TaxID=151549 RepID=A0A4C1UDL8_EUMVA|nr:hypothetical protein EVAR_80073_1 [Eumeta japonica]